MKYSRAPRLSPVGPSWQARKGRDVSPRRPPRSIAFRSSSADVPEVRPYRRTRNARFGYQAKRQGSCRRSVDFNTQIIRSPRTSRTWREANRIERRANRYSSPLNADGRNRSDSANRHAQSHFAHRARTPRHASLSGSATIRDDSREKRQLPFSKPRS